MAVSYLTVARNGVIGVVLAAVPVALTPSLHLDLPHASAHGGGGGGGGDGGGGGGGGNGGGGNGGGADHGGADHAGADHAGADHGGNAGTAAASGHGAHSADVSAGSHGRGSASHGQLSSALGALNAAHASPVALAHASPTSKVGQIASYDRAMLSALGMPATTPAQIAARTAAIAAARAQLANASNKGLTPDVVAAVDSQLGLPASDPSIGVWR